MNDKSLLWKNQPKSDILISWVTTAIKKTMTDFIVLSNFVLEDL